MNEADGAAAFLDGMSAQYGTVSARTKALHDACESLVQEQNELITFNEAVGTRLSYFSELDKLKARLDAPTLSVLNNQFVPMLARVDECIRYISKHPEYKDAASYLARFRQCVALPLFLCVCRAATVW